MKHVVRKDIATMVMVMLCVLLLGGCAKRNIIPDSDLERITREMFLANAYANAEKISTDSMDIYTPILEHYGYTSDDFFNTLANFSKRKSARLGDVIEQTIASLEGLSDGYARKIRDLRYIDSLAKAQCSEEVLWKKRISVTKMKDTTRLHLTIPVREEGEYVVSYVYHVDTLDKNLRLQSDHALYDAEGKRTYLNRTSLSRDVRKEFTTTIKPNKGDREYRLTLADYAHREDEPHITFDSIRITYLPPVERALARMDSTLHFRPMLFFNDSIRAYGYLDARIPRLAHDTVWLRIDSIDMAQMQSLRAGADSLEGAGDKLNKEVEKLLARGEKLRTAAAKKWYRNDSLRMVAHQKNVALADSLAERADSLTSCSKALAEEVLVRRSVADSIEIVLWGEVQPKSNDKKEKR